MRLGHILTLLGAALFLIGATFLPWQHFALADVSVNSLHVSALAYVAIALAAAHAALSGYALASGRRAVTAKANFVGAGVLVGLVLLGRATSGSTYTLMRFEDVGMASGFFVCLWGAVLMGGGALVVLWALPAWDERQPFLRILTTTGPGDRVVSDHVLFEPGVHAVGAAAMATLADPTLARSLPHFRVTREGDTAIGYADESGRAKVAFMKLPFGTRGTIDRGNVRVAYSFVAPIPGRAATRLLENSEFAAITLAVGVVAVIALFLPVLGLRADARRHTACEDGKCAGISIKTEEKVEVADITPEPVQDEEREPDVAKKAGGPEGTFGDPQIDPRIVSKVPAREGAMVHQLDPRRIGLNEVLNTNMGDMAAVAEVLKGDMAAMSNKLAVAMNGEGNEFVLGHGTNGLSFTGDDNGGGGDGDGRFHGQGEIDTGPGGPNVRASLGPKEKRKVGNFDPGPPNTSIGCKRGNIESVVRRRAAVIRACYEQRLQVNKDLKGKVTMRWTITGEGGVDGAVALADTLGDSETTNCLLRAVRRMKFEAPEGGICVIQWPFIFSPG